MLKRASFAGVHVQPTAPIQPATDPDGFSDGQRSGFRPISWNHAPSCSGEHDLPAMRSPHHSSGMGASEPTVEQTQPEKKPSELQPRCSTWPSQNAHVVNVSEQISTTTRFFPGQSNESPNLHTYIYVYIYIYIYSPNKGGTTGWGSYFFSNRISPV